MTRSFGFGSAVLAAAFVLNVATAQAQSVTGVSGSLSDGQSVTISGSNFGTKTDNGRSQTFVNAVWATFSNSLDGGNLSRSDQVTSPNQWTLQTSGNRGEPGGRFARKKYDSNAVEPRLGSLQHVPSTSGSRFYTSFWFKTADPTVMTTGKYYRQYFNSFDFYFHNGAAGSDEQGGFFAYSNNPGAPSTNTIYGSPQGLGFSPGNTWRWVQFLVCLNGCGSIFGSSDYIEHRINNVRFNRRGSQLPSNHMAVEGSASNERESWATAPDGDANGHSIDIGMMIYDGSEGGIAAQSFYDFDDVYIDYAFNRVILSDSATCSGITHGELQIPTAWNTSSITATLNRGSFASNASLYLYVYDANNNCNANGFPVTLGGTGLPAKPTNLHVLPGFFALAPVIGLFRRRRTTGGR
jgi:hypothetical protein